MRLSRSALTPSLKSWDPKASFMSRTDLWYASPKLSSESMNNCRFMVRSDSGALPAASDLA